MGYSFRNRNVVPRARIPGVYHLKVTRRRNDNPILLVVADL